MKYGCWAFCAIFAIVFIYYTIFQGGMTGIIRFVVKNFWWVIGIIAACIVFSFFLGTFDSGKWYNVDSFGFETFFLWFGLIAGLIISLVVALFGHIVGFLFYLFGIIIVPIAALFGVHIQIGKFLVFRPRVKSYKKVDLSSNWLRFA